MSVLCDARPNSPLPAVLPNERALRKAQNLYRGQELINAGVGSRKAWGLPNAETEYVDHECHARSTEYRMDSVWFGQSAQIKQRALEATLQLAA